jgi:hypothetical protein
VWKTQFRIEDADGDRVQWSVNLLVSGLSVTVAQGDTTERRRNDSFLWYGGTGFSYRLRLDAHDDHGGSASVTFRVDTIAGTTSAE